MENKLKDYKNKLEQKRKNIKNYILDMVQKENEIKLTSKNLDFAINELKEIETIEEFIKNDFDYITKERGEKEND